MPDIVIPEFMDEAAIREGLADFDVLYAPDLVDRPGELAAAVREARGLIVRNRTQVRGTLLEAAQALKVVGRLGVGLDNIDTDACAARGIAVLPATGANDVSVAEYVIAAAMMLLRGAYAATPDVIAGTWPRNRLMGRETSGKRLGLAGFGSIARETAKRAAALDMPVAAFDPYVPAEHPSWNQPYGRVVRLGFDELLATSDVLSLHVPLTPETRGMIDAAALALMKPTAYLVNTARGEVVDVPALTAAVRAGRIAGAALDVLPSEPPAADDPVLHDERIVVTPHVAWASTEAARDVKLRAAEDVLRVLRGERPNYPCNEVAVPVGRATAGGGA